MLTIIIDYLPEDKLDKITAKDIIDWYNFFCSLIREGEDVSIEDIYTYLTHKIDNL